MQTELQQWSEYIGDGLWRWSVWVEPETAIPNVREVVFTLHPSFERPVRRCRDRKSKFRLEDITSSPFRIFASVLFVDGSVVLLDSYLELQTPTAAIQTNQFEGKRIVILLVEDDPDVLRAIERDLRTRYRSPYKIVKAQSGLGAVDLLSSLKETGVLVALVISDQRMPGMSGMEVMQNVQRIHPGAKKVLLTAYADTEVALQAINDVRLDRYILKPWDPPEQCLYPALDDLLDSWWPSRK